MKDLVFRYKYMLRDFLELYFQSRQGFNMKNKNHTSSEYYTDYKNVN